MSNEKTIYTDPWNNVSRKRYKLAWTGLMSMWSMTFIQLILLGYGIYHGFTTDDSNALYLAVIVAIVFMVVHYFFYNKVSDYVDEVTEEINLGLWENIQKNITLKYGDGQVIPFNNAPEKVTPPDGETGFMVWLGHKLLGDTERVVWTTPDGVNHQKEIAVDQATFEPRMTQYPRPRKSH